MKTRFLTAIVCAALALSLAAPLSAAPPPPVKPTVTVTADKITITGGQAKKTVSDAFALSKAAWYIVRSSFTGKDSGICQLALVDAKAASGKNASGDNFFTAIGPQSAAVVRSKGRYTAGDYVIYADKADGPWTVEIVKNPKPAPLSTDKTFSGKASAVTPFFHLNKGAANFVIHQKQKSRIAMGIRVLLFNADTGSQTADLIHNSLDPEFKIKKDIPAAGTYLLEISNAPEWDVSYAQ